MTAPETPGEQAEKPPTDKDKALDAFLKVLALPFGLGLGAGLSYSQEQAYKQGYRAGYRDAQKGKPPKHALRTPKRYTT